MEMNLQVLHEARLAIPAADRLARFLASPAGKAWVDGVIAAHGSADDLLDRLRRDLLAIANRLGNSNSRPRNIATGETRGGRTVFHVFSAAPSESRKVDACHQATREVDALRREGLSRQEVQGRLQAIRERIDGMKITTEQVGETTSPQ